MIWNHLDMCFYIFWEEGTASLFISSVFIQIKLRRAKPTTINHFYLCWIEGLWYCGLKICIFLSNALVHDDSFFTCSLPWQGLKAATKKQKYDKICEKKLSTPIEVCFKSAENWYVWLKYTWCIWDVVYWRFYANLIQLSLLPTSITAIHWRLISDPTMDS